MIEVTPVADLYCEGGCAKTVYGIDHDGEDWVLPEGWLELQAYGRKVEHDKNVAAGRMFLAAPEHMCPDCAKDHTPEYVVSPYPVYGDKEYTYCRYCGQEKPCVGDSED